MSPDRVRELLDYDAMTGVFVWRVHRRPCHKPGDIAGNINRSHIARGQPYRQIMIDGQNYRAARLAWLWMKGEWPSGEIDHVNRDSRDDRWANLRLATSSQNKMNRAVVKTSKSGIKGVFQLPSGRWSARAQIGGVYKHLGCFVTAEDAAECYRKTVIDEHKEYAHVV